jgi:riboflavin synthase
MFTGIVVEVGEVNEKTKSKIRVKTKNLAKDVMLGSSICVGGVCLTVSGIDEDILSFDVMDETIKKSIFGEKVNLEGSLRAGDEIGGHFVYGHVDGVGEVVSKIKNYTKIKPPYDLMKFIAPQGSIAIDGVSLTVSSFEESTFTVSLIPFTLENTTLGELKVGSKVNLEVDMLAKYVAKQIITHNS